MGNHNIPGRRHTNTPALLKKIDSERTEALGSGVGKPKILRGVSLRRGKQHLGGEKPRLIIVLGTVYSGQDLSQLLYQKKIFENHIADKELVI